MGASAKRNCAPAGFTLVEMLVVIVIISILAALLAPAIVAALSKAKKARLKTEIAMIENALQQYKEKYGEFPPDFTDATAVTRHLRRVFPNYTNVGNWLNDLAPYGINVLDLDASTALVFWLGGLPDPTGGSKLIGFSANPANPFDTSASRLPAFFDFDERRLGPGGLTGTVFCYYPDTGETNNRFDPYVYFKSRIDAVTGRREYGAVVTGVFLPFRFGTSGNLCVPYLTDASGPPGLPATVRRWSNQKTYQIISAGLDGEFGDRSITGMFPFCSSGTNCCTGDYDNITNFSDTTLEDGMP